MSDSPGSANPNRPKLSTWRDVSRQVALNIRNVEQTLVKAGVEQQEEFDAFAFKSAKDEQEVNPLEIEAVLTFKKLYKFWAKCKRKGVEDTLRDGGPSIGETLPVYMAGVTQDPKIIGQDDENRRFYAAVPVEASAQATCLGSFATDVEALSQLQWYYKNYNAQGDTRSGSVRPVSRRLEEMNRRESTIELRKNKTAKPEAKLPDLPFEQYCLDKGQVMNVDSARLMRAKPLDFLREMKSSAGGGDGKDAQLSLLKAAQKKRITECVPPGVLLRPGAAKRGDSSPNQSKSSGQRQTNYILGFPVAEDLYKMWEDVRCTPPLQRTDEQNEFLGSRLCTLEYFNRMPRAAIRTVCKAIYFRTFGKGEPIYGQGDVADGMYVVDSGKVEMKVKRPSGFWYIACNLFAGEIFGETAMKDTEVHRSATASSAKDGTTMLLLNKGAYEGLSSIETAKRAKQVRNIRSTFGCFSGVSDDTARRLLKESEEMFYPRHTVLMRAATRPALTYFIKRGFCNILKRTLDPVTGDEVVASVGRLGPGDYFGGLLYLDPQDSAARKQGANARYYSLLSEGLDGGPAPFSVISGSEVNVLQIDNLTLVDAVKDLSVLHVMKLKLACQDLDEKETSLSLGDRARWNVFRTSTHKDAIHVLEDQSFAKNLWNRGHFLRGQHYQSAKQRWFERASKPLDKMRIPKHESRANVEEFLLKMAVLDGKTPQRPTLDVQIPDNPNIEPGSKFRVRSKVTGRIIELVVPPGYGPGDWINVVDSTQKEENREITEWFTLQFSEPFKNPDFSKYFSETFIYKESAEKALDESRAKNPAFAESKKQEADSAASALAGARGERGAPSSAPPAAAAATREGLPGVSRIRRERNALIQSLERELEVGVSAEEPEKVLTTIMRLYGLYAQNGQLDEARRCLKRAEAEVLREGSIYTAEEAERTLGQLKRLKASVEARISGSIWGVAEPESGRKSDERGRPIEDAQSAASPFSSTKSPSRRSRVGMARPRNGARQLSRLTKRYVRKKPPPKKERSYIYPAKDGRRQRKSSLRSVGATISGVGTPRLDS